jgi:CRP-like cAMP-binding protein
MKSINADLYEENKRFVNSVPLFYTLTSLQKESIITALTTLKFKSGTKIVEEGEEGDLFFIVKDGTIV